MTNVSTHQIHRRELKLESEDQILSEAERLAAGPYRLLGNWTYGQILDHLAGAIDGFYDGFGFQAPWWARYFIAPMVKKRVLKKMDAGFRLPKQAQHLLPRNDRTVDAGLQHLRRSLARLQSETPSHPHPFFGKMTYEEVRQLMLRHAELHLSFVVPE